MADSDYGKELASLDFKNLIGGPLSAVVEAQAMAAESTVNFIKNMGFDQEGNPQYVTLLTIPPKHPIISLTLEAIAVRAL